MYANCLFVLFRTHRIDATEDDIRRAYRKIVLKHHPDKRKALGEEIKTDDDYFTCITRAYETLSKYNYSLLTIRFFFVSFVLIIVVGVLSIRCSPEASFIRFH